jgi:hypothetical protein
VGRGTCDNVSQRGCEAVGNDVVILVFGEVLTMGRSSLSMSSWSWMAEEIRLKERGGYDSDCETGSSMTLPDRQ